MERDAVWKTIDDERLSMADLLDDLSPAEWDTPSLCTGWRVRDVAAHLTLAHTGILAGTVAFVRAGGGFDRMIRDSAVRQAARLPTADYAPLLRAMVGSRRKAPFISHLEPLIDILVHGQDITIPLHRERAMPPEAAAAAADRVWPDLYPFRAARRLRGVQLRATDHEWSAGEGSVVEGPISALLLLLTGRRAALAQLRGPGLALLP
ncbi:maleylpyruvate isomerase family mycothiol-dependent enzyme [Actinoplanes sp. NPDC049548]|uniref:maleylpyruvate isomerase family mycothiol-dependent enzyme n=1 Tax=Actinoplanes sp. NPDC049548 TaxID=3155152 RepID=UPI003427AA72